MELSINLEKVLQEIKEHNLVNALRLTSGNCGVFAAALRRLLNDGDIYNIAKGCHVVLKLGDQYIDGTGIRDHKTLMGEWGRFGPAKITNDEHKVLEDTGEYHTVDEMEEIIKRLSLGKSVEEFYR